MLIYVRHGKTQADQTSATVGGWSSEPLDSKGKDQAYTLGRTIAGYGLAPNEFSFESSDIPRAAQTADIIGQHIGRGPDMNPSLRTWNTGQLIDTPYETALPIIKKLIAAPYQSAPGGESIGTFMDRFVPTIKEKVASPKIHLVVGHSRGAAVIEGLASKVGGVGEAVNKDFLMQRSSVKPGGIMLIQPDWSFKVENPRGT